MSAPVEKTASQLKSVQVDGQVVLKIMQHCNESLPQLETGQLLGLDVGQTLEVTDCFAFPVRLHCTALDVLPVHGSCTYACRGWAASALLLCSAGGGPGWRP